MEWHTIQGYVLLIVGFGFVIFWHELGHFLAAKWVGIKVEQFAVGFGQALLCWRKGIGLHVGTTHPEYLRRIQAFAADHKQPGDTGEPPAADSPRADQIAAELGLGETEYRLNWIPLGGYVKMLGQDDLNPGAAAENPRAYNRKSIEKRMIVVSAGVVMNIILAALGFMIVFLAGLWVPSAQVGQVVPQSPAQAGGLRVGDKIISYDGTPVQGDFSKLQMNVALSAEDTSVPIVVERPDDAGKMQHITLHVTPRRGDGEFLQLGVGQPYLLEAPKELEAIKDLQAQIDKGAVSAQSGALHPGDEVTAIDDQPVGVGDFDTLDRISQTAYGKPIVLTVQRKSGKVDKVPVVAEFSPDFTGKTVSFAGMEPRVRVNAVMANSAAVDKLKSGDVITRLTIGKQDWQNPSHALLVERLNAAGKAGDSVTIQVLRGGKTLTFAGITLIKLSRDTMGLGIELNEDAAHPIIAASASGDHVLADTPADKAGILGGWTITGITELVGNQKHFYPVASWYDVHHWLGQAEPGTVALTLTAPGRATQIKDLELSADDIKSIADNRYLVNLPWTPFNFERKTSNPLVAAAWGITETRDFVLQSYLTLRRIFGGSVSASQLSGPVGIFRGGVGFAEKGTTWLIWFLAMISANLAVVNFLPIPIVDGGLFLFLILEKAKGKPLSARTQAIAQYVGLAFLLGVILFVTYHDITRPW